MALAGSPMGERERRRAEPDAAGLCGALALWERAERAMVGPAGGRVESEWERFLSLGFKCRCGEGEREGGGEGVRGGQRATARSVAKNGWGIGFGGGGKEIRRRRRASVSNATDDNPDERGRGRRRPHRRQ